MAVESGSNDAPPPRRTGFDAGDRIAVALQALSGLLGAAGVATAAAAAHRGGGASASTAATFMLIHAVAVLGLASIGLQAHRFRLGWLAAALVLFVGTMLFSGDLALAGLLDWRPWPTAAPFGGLLMIFGWLLVFGTGVARMIRPF